MKKLRSWWNLLTDFLITLQRMLFLVVRAHPWHFCGLLILQVIQGLIPLSTAWITKIFFDLLTHSRQAPALVTPVMFLILLLVAQAVVLVIDQVIHPIGQYLQNQLNFQLTLTVKSQIYSKIANFTGLAYFEDPHFQDLIQVTANNAQAGPQQTLGVLTTVVQSLVTLFAFLGVLLSLSPLLALVVIIAVIPQLYAQLRFGRQRFHMIFSNSTREREVVYYGQVLSWVNFAKEVRLFDLGTFFLERFVRKTREIQHVQRQQQRSELRWKIGLAIMTSLVASGAFVVVVVQAFSGQISAGDVALYTSAVISVQGTLANMMFSLGSMNDSVLFFHQYTELLALGQPLRISARPLEVPDLKHGIEIRNVSFRYGPDHPWILRHVNLFIPAHQCVALVGLNGAGKTTLVKLLTRLYDPTEGEILWDSIDIRDFDPQAFRQHIGAIFQDFTRYELSVQENIGLGDVTHITDTEAAREAAQKAGIHGRITRLNNGYQSVLSRMLAENSEGVDFSGGEWQKLALARMFMRNADLLILDEPTASLDAEAEYELYQQFRDLMQGHTCLLITHRFSSIRMADIVAVLEDGEISEYGRHDHLVAQGGRYADLYTLQAQSYK